MTGSEFQSNVSASDSFTSKLPAVKEVMDGRAAYQYVVTQLQQTNIRYGTIKTLIPNRMMLYGEDGWGIVVTPTLIFTESEFGISLHLLKSPINLRDKNWQGKGIDWDLSYRQEIPDRLIPSAIRFVDNLVTKARKLEASNLKPQRTRTITQ